MKMIYRISPTLRKKTKTISKGLITCCLICRYGIHCPDNFSKLMHDNIPYATLVEMNPHQDIQ